MRLVRGGDPIRGHRPDARRRQDAEAVGGPVQADRREQAPAASPELGEDDAGGSGEHDGRQHREGDPSAPGSLPCTLPTHRVVGARQVQGGEDVPEPEEDRRERCRGRNREVTGQQAPEHPPERDLLEQHGAQGDGHQ